MERQQTIQNEAGISGRGLMLGEAVELTFKSAPEDYGVVFHRIDLPGDPSIKVCPDNYEDAVPRCTSLRSGDATISSVEHLLSALAGMRIDNVSIDINAPEPPALDGSALPYVNLIKKAGIIQQNAPRSSVELSEPFAVYDNDKQLILLPSDIMQVSFVYDHLSNHRLKLQLTPSCQRFMKKRLRLHAVFVSPMKLRRSKIRESVKARLMKTWLLLMKVEERVMRYGLKMNSFGTKSWI